MRIGILGGGSVGQTLAEGFKRTGHDVRLGIRAATTDTLAEPRNQAKPLGQWRDETGIAVVTLAEAAAHGEVVVNATKGAGTLAAMEAAGHGNLQAKVLIDVSNHLDFSHGMPPSLLPEYSGRTSLAEQVQAAVPGARVVKAFNTVTAAVMVEPGLAGGEHDLFLSGDEGGKEVVRELARGLGWTRFADLGGIEGARAQEMFVMIWMQLWQTSGDPLFGYRIVRAS